jgi:hypothetical protein
MTRERLQWLMRPDTLKMVGKLGVVLGLETLLMPPTWAAVRLAHGEIQRERVLAAQNKLRRVALRWLLPDLVR